MESTLPSVDWEAIEANIRAASDEEKRVSLKDCDKTVNHDVTLIRPRQKLRNKLNLVASLSKFRRLLLTVYSRIVNGTACSLTCKFSTKGRKLYEEKLKLLSNVKLHLLVVNRR